MMRSMSNPASITHLAEACLLFPTTEQTGIWIDTDGAIETVSLFDLPTKLARATPMVCYKGWTATRLGVDLGPVLDVLELAAFLRPAQFCLPTPDGLASLLGLQKPRTSEDQALTIGAAAASLLDEIDRLSEKEQREIADIADMMGRGGWKWANIILTRLGSTPKKAGPPDGAAAAIWRRLPEITDIPPRGEAGLRPVMPDAARNRLSEMLGGHAETRHQQADYAAATAQIFNPPDEENGPSLLLAEAGTGTGKTLGYLAPSSLWAEQNSGAVWVSTYTRTLQHQIADEMRRLEEDETRTHPRVVIRKGRENYLCLLNLEEALGQMPGQPAHAIALGLMARWAGASSDGDLTGAYFPAWLVDLLGTRHTLGLADRRGECIHSACAHYHKCFIEKSVRLARRADIVVANHALVMMQAVLGAEEDRSRPTRYIFDEGHHVFDAADSAFSSLLSAQEAAELRRWVRGVEDGRRGRARGLTKRLGEILADDAEALALLEEASEAARCLPDTGWRARLSGGGALGPSEKFFQVLREVIYNRTTQPDSLYNIQCDLHPLPESLRQAALPFLDALKTLQTPLLSLAKAIAKQLDERSAELDSQMRARLEGAIRGLEWRANGPLASWSLILSDCIQTSDGRDGFIDWMELDRLNGQDRDVGIARHYLDPSQPFAEAVLKPAHGVSITSATLRDSNDRKTASPLSGDQPADRPASLHEEYRQMNGTSWMMAEQLTGAAHLPQPALRTHHRSPFDYAANSRILVVTDLARDRADATAAAMAEMMQASGGGALGLFTAIQRLRSVYPDLMRKLSRANLPLYAQHMDRMNLQTLLQLFRADPNSCLIGTDAVRDGVDVPGDALRLMIYDRVPWPRPDMLFKARVAWQGREAWTEYLTRMKLRQAYGRLIRRNSDRGIFVMLDNRLPTRLTTAFPEDVEIERVGLAEAIRSIGDFFAR